MSGAPVILKTRVDALRFTDAVERILGWARRRESRYVCLVNAYNVMLGRRDRQFLAATNAADLAACDGKPLQWMQRLLGFRSAERVYGPHLMLALAEACAIENLPVALYGGRPDTVALLVQALRGRFPGLQIPVVIAPPGLPVRPDMDMEAVRRIREAGAAVVFVGLGTPKQDYWMAAHRPALPAVMVGVGAAFDFLAGSKPQSPAWMMRCGLEWLFRLATEPRRLWRRYLSTVPAFAFLAAAQLARGLWPPKSRGGARHPAQEESQ